ncbi:uncharacterized protein [Amphiura filiformis]|uniref:uncharacterized protein n=1 Tax=Amphiura filiformis TaxID=82378 RepID=UPI003B220F6D
MPVQTTPPQVIRPSEMMHLESAILSKARDQAYYTKLQDWLISQQTDDASPQICSVEMMKKVITVLQGELQCQQFQQARVIVLAIQHVTKFIDFFSFFPVLLSSGLVEILGDVGISTHMMCIMKEGT